MGPIREAGGGSRALDDRRIKFFVEARDGASPTASSEIASAVSIAAGAQRLGRRAHAFDRVA